MSGNVPISSLNVQCLLLTNAILPPYMSPPESCRRVTLKSVKHERNEPSHAFYYGKNPRISAASLLYLLLTENL